MKKIQLTFLISLISIISFGQDTALTKDQTIAYLQKIISGNNTSKWNGIFNYDDHTTYDYHIAITDNKIKCSYFCKWLNDGNIVLESFIIDPKYFSTIKEEKSIKPGIGCLHIAYEKNVWMQDNPDPVKMFSDENIPFDNTSPGNFIQFKNALLHLQTLLDHETSTDHK